MKYTIRRHLSKGKHYGFWQVRGYVTDSQQGAEVEYINPDTHTLEMYECRLLNKFNASNKIYTGKTTKNPCAYIICESYEISESISPVSDDEITFNPHNSPNWMLNKESVDGQAFEAIVSSNKHLYKL